MASGEGTKYPGPVDFKDNEKEKKKNQDYVSVFLEVPGLKVTKPPFSDAKPDNATVNRDFKPGSLEVRVTVKGTDGKSTVYEYNKNLPEDINPDKSSVKYKKDTVILYLCKASQGSWAEHSNYFIRQGK